MSAQASAWAWTAKIEVYEDAATTTSIACQRFVLVFLGDHAWPDGSHAWPGVEEIAVKTSMHPRTVQRALRALQAQGLIVEERPATPHLPTMYALAVDNPGPGVVPRHRGGGVASVRGGAAPPKPIVNPGSLGDAVSVPEPVDECGCRHTEDGWDRCADHGGGLTVEDRRRIVQGTVPPLRKEEGA